MHWNEVSSSEACFAFVMAISTPLSKLFLLMRVPLTVALLSVEEHGHYQVNELCGNASLSRVEGALSSLVNYCIVGLFSERYSLLPALSIIWAKIVEGSFTEPLFQEFIAELLTRMQLFPGKNSVIIMDNTCIHKNQEVIDMIEERYVLWYYHNQELFTLIIVQRHVPSPIFPRL